ncbi:helix-turn-helix domain-containing protein [Amycolatopsis sp. NPDC059027]|uniref:GbsR/MarR family transcriptional regulator n=1 Tax=unclassified Amycolatopsis TaxID=2618356 RepID=UPI00366AD8F4
MPGGRLSPEDRQRIAAGLADGLGYAEIARRLGRPTSTVSREVSRNGGARGYRADYAQLATGRRARRGGLSASAAASTEAVEGRDVASIDEFEREFAAMMTQSGFPRMMSRVFVSLYLSDTGSRTAAELAHRLGVSPASVSKAVAYLEKMELLTRVRDSRRRERYVVDGDAWYRAWAASFRSVEQWGHAARRGAGLLGTTTPTGARLDEMGEIFEHLGHEMTEAAEHWRRVVTARRVSPPAPRS